MQRGKTLRLKNQKKLQGVNKTSRALFGFTLIELLIYVGLVSIFLTAATSSLLDIVFGSVKSSVEQEVQENLRYVTQRVQFEIRNADTINSGSSFGINLASDSTKSLSLATPSPNNPTEFRVSGGILQIKQGSGSWTVLTSSVLEVTNLVFTKLSDSNSENISFTVTVKYRNPSGRIEWDKTSTFEGASQLR